MESSHTRDYTMTHCQWGHPFSNYFPLKSGKILFKNYWEKGNELSKLPEDDLSFNEIMGRFSRKLLSYKGSLLRQKSPTKKTLNNNFQKCVFVSFGINFIDATLFE